MSEESNKVDRKPRSFHGRIAIDVSLRETAGKYAACGWVVVQMNLDGDEEPWYGVACNMPIELEVQRTIKRADICALYMALCRLNGPAGIYSDNRGVVQALNRGQANCIAATHKDADL